jgi:tight adherence protein C
MNSMIWLLPLVFATIAGAILVAGVAVMRYTAAAGAGETDTLPGTPWQHRLADAVAVIGRMISPKRRAPQDLYKLLFRAGYRQPGAAMVFQGLQVIGAAALGLVIVIVIPAERTNLPLALLAAAGFGFLLPGRILEFVVRRRMHRLRSALPPCLDLLVLALEAGQPLEQAMQDTAQALRTAFPELSSELVFCSLEIRAGTSRLEALHRLGERSGEEELRRIAAVLVDGERFGASLGPALRSHAHYLRGRMRQRAQEQARKLTVKLVLPVFFLIFPSVLLVTLGPAYLQLRHFLDDLLK